MRLGLNYDFTSVCCFLENLGFLRLSAFFSVEKSSQGEKAQKVARFVIGVFVMLGTYDFIARSLPFQIRIVVRGALCVLVSCLSLSILLRSLPKSTKIDSPKKAAPSPEKTVSNKKEDVALDLAIDIEGETKAEEEQSKEEISFKSVRRNLLPDFERSVQEENE